METVTIALVICWLWHLLAMAFADYGGAQMLEGESLVEVLTPRTIVAMYRFGFEPRIHESTVR